MANTLEFYLESMQSPFLRVETQFSPVVGEQISIKGVTWVVIGRSYSVDYSSQPHQSMRCNLIVEKDKTK